MKFLGYEKRNVKRFRGRSDYQDVISTNKENVEREHWWLIIRLIPRNNFQALANSEACRFIDGAIDDMSKLPYFFQSPQTFELFSHTIAICIDQRTIVFRSRDTS